MKSITIAGNVGKNAETRATQQGDKVTGFPVAVDDGFGDKKRTIWFDCSMWGKRGETLAQYITKGGKITVTGDLSTREYDGKTYLTIRAHDVTLQGGGQGGGGQSTGTQYREDNGPQGDGYGAGGRPSSAVDDDAIPFSPCVLI